MKEGKIERKLVDYCRKKGVLCYKFSSPARAGVSDRILVFPRGHVVFLELKATGAKLTELQKRELKILVAQNAHAYWSDSFEWCKKFIDSKLENPPYVTPVTMQDYKDFV